MRGVKKLYLNLISVIFMSFFLGYSVEAAIDVSGYKNFGYYINDFSLDSYTAFNSGGESYDLRRDVDYLGYRGKNISDDFTLNGNKIEVGKYYYMNSKSDTIVIKKMGVHNGRYLEVRITPEVTPMRVKLNADNINEMLEIFTKDLNETAKRFDLRMTLFYEGTETQPIMESNRTFLLPVKHVSGWPDYNFVMLLERSSKVLVGNEDRDYIARTYSKTYMDSSKYRIAVGGKSGSYNNFHYNILFNKPLFYIGKSTVGNFTGNTTRLFEPIGAPSSMPKPYNNLTFESKTVKNESVSPTNDVSSTFYSEINYQLPEQEKESFIPESIDLVIHDNVRDYSEQDGFLFMDVPTLTINEKVIDKKEYTYSTYTNKLTFSKDFLKKYAGESICIRTGKILVRSGSLGNEIKKWYLGENKFEIPTSLSVESHYDTFSRKEFDEDSSGIMEMKIVYSLYQDKDEVELGKKSTDYSENDFFRLFDVHPYEHVSYEIQEKQFNILTNEETLPVRIYSSFLETSILIELPLKVYENLPIVYKLEDGTLITSENQDLPHEVKRYSETPVKFKIPFTFDNYTFVSSSNEELQFGETVDNFKEATGVLNTTTKEIGLIYKMNKIGVTIEYLLDSETGQYEKHKPIKVGTELNQNKPNNQLEIEIGQKMTDFIKNNKSQVNPKIPYYHNNQEVGKTANYWRYSDEPVSGKNQLRPVDSEDKIPSRPITITSFYSGTASLNSVDDIDFGTHKNNLKVNEITSKKAINYSFVDTTFNKQTSLNVRFDVPMKNEKNKKMTAFMLDYKGKSINQQDVPVIKSKDTEKNIFTGDLKSDLLFKRYWLGPENFGQFSGVLVWTISRDITP